ncbi:filamentous hemagglutinin [Trinickia symbiotica]|uniref:Filamentous hemagglutinin n=1 Tax=Trinickia symbiotica TaxID=863227 RepID=A0A2T3XVQ3_9BURK|nr:filamentous hemagglutinin N-terminal domain-containing protein [Trinickia symbiotica]PTB20603.1 filamentous hemagglutinin [Trinickia symbiotica]
MAHASWMGHPRSRHTTQSALSLIFLSLWFGLPAGSYAAGPLPGGGQFVAGTGSINGNAGWLTINQTSSRGVIDWNSFSIGGGNHVNFNNGTGATLNRVTGASPSSILGTLTATGSVYLINPQGIVIGSGGVIATNGRFVASTLDTDNAAFMAGGPLTLSGNSTASVINLGKIASSGGDVFLIARNEVDNFGSIGAPKGTAELAAGKTVLLQDSSGSRQVFVQTGSGGTVLNGGTIEAAQISLQAADGNVFALAGNHDVLRATGTATRDGHVWLVADTGTVALDNPVRATNADGSGGTVDTAAGTLTVSPSAAAVLAGIWNIATPAFTIGTSAAAVFTRSLNAGTSINLRTTGAGGQTGDITVASNLRWKHDASLTLGAWHTLTVGKGVKISNQGGGNLTLRADAAGIDNQGSVVNNGIVDWSNSTGTVSALYDMNGAYTPGTLLSNAAWTPAQGSGLTTQITGYELVNSIADLENISQNLAGNYALGRDVDGAGANFTPIGNATTPFTGQFDGMFHAINNVSIVPVVAAGGTLSPSGLFGIIGSMGVVRNLNLTNGELGNAGYNPSTTEAGLLAGINRGHITNVFASGQLSISNYAYLGGLVGENDGLIERSGTDVYVLATESNLAGLVGKNNGTITQSYSTGAVTGVPRPAVPGGLVSANNGTISQSFVTGPISRDPITDPHPGAIAAVNFGTVTADNYWNVQTTGTTNGGGAPAANGLTTAQMSNPASFVGWDFGPNGVWVMPPGWTHPVLRWQLATGNLPAQ